AVELWRSRVIFAWESKPLAFVSLGVGFLPGIMFKLRLLRLTFLFLALVPQASAQFAHTDHKQILDGGGKPLLLRATNLGNWLVPRRVSVCGLRYARRAGRTDGHEHR